MGDPTDYELLARSKADPDAFGEFYRRHARALLGFLASQARSPEDAIDLTAEVFAAAFLARGRFRPDGPPARAWLFGIARHKLADSYRQARLEDGARRRLGVRAIAVDESVLERVEELADLERDGILEIMLEDLPVAEREAVIARVIHERDYLRVADELKCSENAARKRVSRGLARLAVWAKEERS